MAKKIVGGILIAVAIVMMVVEIPKGNLEPIVPSIIFGLVGLFLLLKKFKSKEEKVKIKAESPENNQVEIGDQQEIKPKSRKKRLFIPVFILVVAAGLTASIVYAVQNADKLGTTPEGKLAKNLNVSVEQAEEVLNILKVCGIDKVKSAEHDALLDNANVEGETGYRVVADGHENIILYLLPDKTVNIVRYADHDLYAEGNMISKLTDYVMSVDEMSSIQWKCQEAVKTTLSSPLTAKFPNINHWKFSKTPEKIIVQSYVDAQNGFGAMIRSEFQFVLTPDGSTISSFIFDGKELVSH